MTREPSSIELGKVEIPCGMKIERFRIAGGMKMLKEPVTLEPGTYLIEWDGTAEHDAIFRKWPGDDAK